MPVTVAAQTSPALGVPECLRRRRVVAELLARRPHRHGRHGRPSLQHGLSTDSGARTSVRRARSRFRCPEAPATSTSTTGATRRPCGRDGHTGTDLSVACGTPVLAATNGKVIIRTDQGWAGRWLVEVCTGAGPAHHLVRPHADARRRTRPAVSAGQQIGEVGDLGNATGCHLHFEVHPQGGSIYEDNVDPTAWLQRTSAEKPTVDRPRGLAEVHARHLQHPREQATPTARGKHPRMASGSSAPRD